MRLQVLFLGLPLSLFAQVQDPGRQRSQQASTSYSPSTEPSDLAKENLARVAASAAQIRVVLVKEPGILVELKRWVAKEATDNGQIVEDSALTDEAIFERLERDVAFRSVATLLVQRYGYLLPSFNPTSDIAMEQELVLREHARRLGQIESQGDSQALQYGGNRESMGQRMQQPQFPPGAAHPGETPNRTSQLQPAPSANNPQILQANAGQGESESQIAAIDGVATTLPNGNFANFAPPPMESGAERALAPPVRSAETIRLPGERGFPNETERELSPVEMIRKHNPYSDIPSLYDMYVQASSRERPLERFGLNVFRNGTRQPDAIPMDLPVGPDYVVGPGDGLTIDLWGGVSQRLFRIVDREGRVSLPEAGPVLVSGQSLGQVQQDVQQILRTQFRDVSADVSLSRLRTVRVYVVGEVAEPGAYDISSLSTPLNALFAAGGVSSRGSLRALKHYRGKQLVEEVDAYDLLLHGVQGKLARLENGDTLLVPPAGPQVTIEGMVRRPAIYELHGETSLEDALELAGGILPAAALQHIEVQRLVAHEERTMLSLNLPPNSDPSELSKELAAFKIQDGDKIHIFPIAPYNQKVVYLEGHVLRPGPYSYRDGMKLSDLIASYKDLLPEPSGHYAEIVRLNPPDYRPSVESFDLSAALANPGAAPKLQPLDTVRIFSRYDFEAAPSVWVGGEVRSPGKYRTSGEAHLRDAIFLAGGTSPDASLDSAQLFRTQPDGTMRILSVNLREALAGNPVDNLILQPRDRILVHRNSAQVDPPTVYVKGEVAKPGRYPLATNMRVEDLIRVAGGLKRSADPGKADLTRYSESDPHNVPAAQTMAVDLSAVMSGNAAEDIPLRDGDVLTVRQIPGWNDIGASVTLRGEVRHPGTYGIRPGERLSSVLERAGGFTAEGYPYGAVLMRREVRDIEMKFHSQLVQRVRSEEINLKALPESDEDQKNAKLTAIAQTETALQQLQSNDPIGRVVVHIQPNLKEWRGTPADVPLRDGDVLVIPKQAAYVMVTGQVFNQTAVSYHPGRSAKWYLSQAGGLTQVADKKAVFVIRADGSVLAAKNNSTGWWSGDPLSAKLRPGDTIVIPEKMPKIGSRNWAMTMQAAQLASSIALTVAYIHP
jgi:protein involved in polysaccharide export with SLBB domain